MTPIRIAELQDLYIKGRSGEESYEAFLDAAELYYRQNLGNIFDTYYKNVVCGVSIGPGWIPLYIETAHQMAAVGLQIKINQVKQKFGGLRIYWQPQARDETVEEALFEIVAAADLKAATTCETCGQPGKLYSWRVECTEHTKESHEAPLSFTTQPTDPTLKA